MKLLLSAAVAATLGAAVSASGMTIFFTSTPFQPGVEPPITNPVIELTEGDTATLYYWARPANTSINERIAAIFLNSLVTVPGIVQATSHTFFQAFNAQGFPRWGMEEDPVTGELFNNGISNGPLVPGGLFQRAVGIFLAQAAPGYGIRINTAPPDPTTDSLRAGNSFLLGQVTFNAVTPGTTDVFLRVGGPDQFGVGGGIAAPQNAPMTIFFGADEPVSVTGTVNFATGIVPDATIIVNPIPEPTSLAALALGGLLLVRRRRA